MERSGRSQCARQTYRSQLHFNISKTKKQKAKLKTKSIPNSVKSSLSKQVRDLLLLEDSSSNHWANQYVSLSSDDGDQAPNLPERLKRHHSFPMEWQVSQ